MKCKQFLKTFSPSTCFSEVLPTKFLKTIFAKFIEKKFALSLALEKKSALVLW